MGAADLFPITVTRRPSGRWRRRACSGSGRCARRGRSPLSGVITGSFSRVAASVQHVESIVCLRNSSRRARPSRTVSSNGSSAVPKRSVCGTIRFPILLKPSSVSGLGSPGTTPAGLAKRWAIGVRFSFERRTWFRWLHERFMLLPSRLRPPSKHGPRVGQGGGHERTGRRFGRTLDRRPEAARPVMLQAT